MNMDEDVLLDPWKQINLRLEERKVIAYALKSPPWKLSRKMGAPFFPVFLLMLVLGGNFATNFEMIANVWAMGERAQALLYFALLLLILIFVALIDAERTSRKLAAAYSVIKKLDERGFVASSEKQDSSYCTTSL